MCFVFIFVFFCTFQFAQNKHEPLLKLEANRNIIKIMAVMTEFESIWCFGISLLALFVYFDYYSKALFDSLKL